MRAMKTFDVCWVDAGAHGLVHAPATVSIPRYAIRASYLPTHLYTSQCRGALFALVRLSSAVLPSALWSSFHYRRLRRRRQSVTRPMSPARNAGHPIRHRQAIASTCHASPHSPPPNGNATLYNDFFPSVSAMSQRSPLRFLLVPLDLAVLVQFWVEEKEKAKFKNQSPK